MDPLRKDLLKVLKYKTPSGSSFASKDDVCAIMTKERVSAALNDGNYAQHCKFDAAHIPDVLKVILCGAQRIFAILVQIQATRFIQCFIQDDPYQNDALDSRLPFTRGNLNRILNAKEFPFISEEFFSKQWQFAAPIFFDTTFTRSLPPETILPFTKDEKLGEGSFGQVWSIEIPAPNHRYHDGLSPLQCVRKEFKFTVDNPMKARKSYMQELQNHSILKLVRHPNIMEALSCYEHNGNLNLIFLKAESGSLQDVLDGDGPNIFRSEADTMLALCGLTSAIHTVHQFFSSEADLKLIGCHHDLKPANILVQGGRLLLADFGLSKFKSEAEGSETNWKLVHPHYAPPECWRRRGEKDIPTVRRSGDIWSWACVMTEVITFMESGAAGVKEFYERRIFEETETKTSHRFHRAQDSDPAVTKWLEDRRRHESRTVQMMSNLLKRMLSINPNKRPEAPEVEARMRFIGLYALCQLVQRLYIEICETCPSIDGRLEQIRFESWRLAYELGDESLRFVLQKEGDFPRWTDSYNFDATHSTLREIHSQLKQVLVDCEEPQYSVFRPIRQMNDSLVHRLGADARLRFKDYTSIRMMELATKELDTKDWKPEGDDQAGYFRKLKSILVMTETIQEQPIKAARISVKHLDFKKKVGDFEIQHLTNSQNASRMNVVVESKSYSEQQANKDVATELHNRLQDVTALIQRLKKAGDERFRVLPCVGYYHNASACECGVVYRFPGSSPNLRLVTLHSVLQNGSVPLERRMDLAYTLSASIAEFHAAKWLQKNVSSFNVVFFYKDDGRSRKSEAWMRALENPYFLGFMHSKGQELGFTEGPTEDEQHRLYQHSEYLKGVGRVRYSQKHEYYSLGLVLLEIGLWKPLPAIVKANKPEEGRTRSNSDYIISQVVPQLSFLTGNRYRQVVRRCLEGDLEVDTSIAAEEERHYTDLHLHFSRLIVQQLAKCSGRCTTSAKGEAKGGEGREVLSGMQLLPSDWDTNS